jgi:hypothetical protein
MLLLGETLERVFPGYGKQQLHRILRLLAQAQTGTHDSYDSLHYLPLHHFPGRSLVVVLSPLIPADWPLFPTLRAYGHQALLISPDPLDFARPLIPDDESGRLALRAAHLERQMQLWKIAQLQIPVIDWKVSQPLYPLVRSALLRKASFLVCLLAAAACLAGGYALAGFPAGVLFAVLALLAWLYAWRPANGWLAGLCLAASTCLAAVGILLQAPPSLMILGAVLTLATWDLLLLDHSMPSHDLPPGSRLLEIRRLQSLAAVLGVGLFAAFASRLVSVSLPFGLMVLAVLLALFALDRLARYLGSRG